MRKTRLIGAGIAAVLAAAVMAGGVAILVREQGTGGGQKVAAFREARTFAISSTLMQIEGPYSLLLGDSQLERLFLPRLCGHPAVNAAIAGTRAAGLRAVADDGQRPGVAIEAGPRVRVEQRIDALSWHKAPHEHEALTRHLGDRRARPARRGKHARAAGATIALPLAEASGAALKAVAELRALYTARQKELES